MDLSFLDSQISSRDFFLNCSFPFDLATSECENTYLQLCTLTKWWVLKKPHYRKLPLRYQWYFFIQDFDRRKKIETDSMHMQELFEIGDGEIKKKSEVSEVNEVNEVTTIKTVLNITISPDPDNYTPQDLIRFINGLAGHYSTYYGVYERGTKSKIFHCHFIMEVRNNDDKTNFISKIKRTFKPHQKRVDYPTRTQLLKTLRYYHMETKDNCGVFGNLEHFKNKYLENEIINLRFN